MAFNSFLYAGFFLCVFVLVAFVLRHRVLGRIAPLRRWHSLQIRNGFLLFASYVFYGTWDYRFLSLIWISTLVDFFCGQAIARATDPKQRRRMLALSLIANLGLLAVFKYFDFFARSFAAVAAEAGVTVEPWLLDVVLPAGISFYTFQTLSYSIDVYRGHIPAEKNLLSFAVFVAFFPQLVAGPIERAKKLLPQFARTRPITLHKLESGAFLIGAGLFKKVVVADNVARVADAAFALKEPSAIQVLAGVYAFAFQIYCDFSGYTDIARGSARCLGFELSRNFDNPYLAITPSDFWQRWHISLSSWLRDYLYIPLGGNRHGRRRTTINLALTMLLGGLWHGAAWTFVAWGAFHGALLGIYRALTPYVAPWLPRTGYRRFFVHAVGLFSFFHLTCFSWLLFRAESMSQAATMAAALASPSSASLSDLDAVGPWQLGTVLVALLLLVHVAKHFARDHWLVFKLPLMPRALVYAACVMLFALVGEDRAAPFIYFQF